MASDDHDRVQQVTAPLTQLATGLPIETRTCPTCGQPLRAGTPVSVQLVYPDTHWQVRTVRSRQCPPPHTPAQQPTHLLTATLSRCSHVQMQTHTLCLADLEPHTTEIPTNP